MQASWQDRLVHILVHPEIETLAFNRNDPFVKENPYFYPTEAWVEKTDIPKNEQLELYDIPFPRLKEITNNIQNIAIIQKALSEPYLKV